MDPIRAFISYSSAQKIIGGRFKICLTNYCGYDAFIAHDDMPAASVFQEEILKKIANTDLFIPLLSEDFKKSDFTDQETGLAVGFQKKIIPIKLDTINPYGFIDKYHALQYKMYPPHYYYPDNIKELVLTIAQIVLNEDKFHDRAINSLINAFCSSLSFEATNATIELMLKYDHFSKDQLQQIINAINTNPQIKGAWGLEGFKEFLHNTYNITID